MSLIAEQGFEIVPGVFDSLVMKSTLEALEQAKPHRSRAGARNILRIPAVDALARDARLMQFATATLGQNAFPFRATLFDKSTASNWLVVWHQDTALPLRERREVQGWGPWSAKEGVICAHAPAQALEQVLAIRIHLDDSTSENGPLKALPKTHKCGVLSDDAIHDLAETIPAVECAVAVGGLLLMSPLLVHASSKAKSDAMPRRVLHVEYASAAQFSGGIKLASC
jgi:ectoine hydroxylase-related dioxygenase (phytanoyl-CoA dioxygenase family)